MIMSTNQSSSNREEAWLRQSQWQQDGGRELWKKRCHSQGCWEDTVLTRGTVTELIWHTPEANCHRAAMSHESTHYYLQRVVGAGENPPRSFARSLHSNTIYFIVPIHFTLFESSCPLLLVKTMLMVPTKGNSNEYRVLKSWCMDSDVLLAVAIPLNQCHFEECNVLTPACFLKVFHNTQSNEMSGVYMIKTNN